VTTEPEPVCGTVSREWLVLTCLRFSGEEDGSPVEVLARELMEPEQAMDAFDWISRTALLRTDGLFTHESGRALDRWLHDRHSSKRLARTLSEPGGEFELELATRGGIVFALRVEHRSIVAAVL